MNTYFIMMVGLPASGKSTKAKELSIEYDAFIHSSDELRKELYGNIDTQDKNNKLFLELHKRIKDDLKNGKSVIYDACNISYKRRKAFLTELKMIDCKKICILAATLYEDCLEQNNLRERQIPEKVITRMYKSFNIPYWYEGWDDIQIVYNSDKNTYSFPTRYMHQHMEYSQDNPYHKLSLGEHLKDTWKYVCYKDGDLPLRIASVLHDCGKPFTKAFLNSKGEKTDIAHYFQHHCCGAYDSLFFRTVDNPLDHAIIIQWHMQPYSWEKNVSEKQISKYKKLWGEKLFADIMLLHKADKLAH